LPQLAVPVARYGGVGSPDQCRLEGLAVPFDKETLKKLFPTHDSYVAKVKEAVAAAEKAGFLLPPEAADEIREAEAAAIP
jgi:hypothetical protein